MAVVVVVVVSCPGHLRGRGCGREMSVLMSSWPLWSVLDPSLETDGSLGNPH